MKTCREVHEHIESCQRCQRLAREQGAAVLGRRGGSVRSPAKRQAAINRAQKQRDARAQFVATLL